MTTKEHYIKNAKLALPVVLSQMGHIAVSVADSVMVGRIGAVPLASVSLANSVFSIFMLFGIGVTYGATPLVAAADGTKDVFRSTNILKNSIFLNTPFGLFMMLLCLTAIPGLSYLGQDVEVMKGAIPYFEMLAYSLFPLIIFQTFKQFTEGLSMTKQAMFISISGNLLNVGLNYLFIFGKWGMPSMGVTGAGLATLISRVVMAIAMFLFVITYRDLKQYVKLFNKAVFEFNVIRKILKLGVPSGLQYIFEIGAFSASAVMVGWIGPLPLAAHQIVLNLSGITYMIATGIATASSIRIGNQLGKGDYKNLKKVGETSFVMTGVLMVFFSIGFIVFRYQLPLLYVDDDQVIGIAVTLMLVAALYQVSDGIQAVGLGILRGLTDVKIPTIVTLVSYWLIAIPVGYLLGIYLEWGAAGVWTGLCVGLTVAGVAHVIRFKRLLNRKDLSS